MTMTELPPNDIFSDTSRPKKERAAKQPKAAASPPVPAPLPAPTTMLELIARAAADPSIDVAKFSALLDIKDRETKLELELAKIEAEAAFNRAMATVQAKMGRIATDAANSQTRSQYATYGQLDRHIRPIYTGAGFSISFNEDVGAVGADAVRVIAYVTHTDPSAKVGHTRIYHCDIPADGKGAKGNDVMTKTHAHGSAFTYGKRYLLGMVFNIALGKDDDGNAAPGRPGVTSMITEEQVANLEGLIAQLSLDPIKVCQAYRVNQLSGLTTGQYENAKGRLESMMAGQP